MTKTKVTLRIAGREYTIIGDDPEEHIERIGLYVDKKMREIIGKSTRVNTATVSVLAAINLTDELFKAKASEKKFKSELTEAKKSIESLQANIQELTNETERLNGEKSNFQLNLAKREAELAEVRSSIKKGY